MVIDKRLRGPEAMFDHASWGRPWSSFYMRVNRRKTLFSLSPMENKQQFKEQVFERHF